MEIDDLKSFPCALTARGILEHFRREVNRRLPEWSRLRCWKCE